MSLRQIMLPFMLSGLLLVGYLLTGQSVTLQIDGHLYTIQSHASQVQTIIQQMGLTLNSADRVDPPLTATITPDMVIKIRLARPIQLQVDGQIKSWFTQQTIVSDLIEEAHLKLTPYDEIWQADQILDIQAPLPPPFVAQLPDSFLSRWLVRYISPRPEPLELTLRRATPIQLHIGALNTMLYTTQPTLQEALQQRGLRVWPEDKIAPPLTSPIRIGMMVYLQPAKWITLTVDGQTMTRRTQAETVGAALAEANIALMGQDFTRPSFDQKLTAQQNITVIRVRQGIEVTETYLPFETTWQASDELELDQQVMVETGQAGIIKSRWRVRYENGQGVQRELQDEWLAQEAKTRSILYGTKIVLRTMQTPHGPIEYWRKVSMLTTSYSAATSGKPRNHPNYGFTRTGKQAGFGLVAVDPRVIPLHTKMYIPNYGPAAAEDTGGGVLGKHVDLGFNEDSPPLWYGWHEIYLLPPIPPLYQIRYILPEWPQ